MQAIPQLSATPNHPTDTSSIDGLSEQYDFIIIGGGTAGLVVAARLSEDPSTSVIVIEAGAKRLDDPRVLTPGLCFGLYDDPNYDWCLASTPQKELNGRIVPQQRGKLLGGSSAIFQFQLVYPSASSCDAWEKLGNSGWNYANMLPYFHKFHTHHDPTPADTIRGILSGSLKTEARESSEGDIQSSFSDTTPINKAWVDSWGKILEDLEHEGGEVGPQATPTSIDPKTKTRSYAATAYYSADIASRPNLRVVTGAMVSKIGFQRGSEVVATGVEFEAESGVTLTVKAGKEVILSAGTMKSPQILELSGIGDPKLLSQHGIEVMVDNPNVGEHLVDHQAVPMSFEVADGVQTGEIMMRDPSVFPALLEMYQKSRSGPLSGNYVDMAQFRLPETFQKDGKDFVPSLLQSLAPAASSTSEKLEQSVIVDLLSESTAQYSMALSQFNVAGHSKITEMVGAEQDGNYATIFTALNHPFSQGSIHIASSSQSDDPIIDPRYLSHPMDLELLARHVQFLSTLITTSPLAEFLKPDGRRIPNYAFPPGKEMTLEAGKQAVREQLISNCHPAGTCTMGPRSAGGVVDKRLRVHGVRGLRVVDASVFPVMPQGNIITSVYAVAERAADLIKADWEGK